jgi:transcriptional regulator with XRE-family HTH domain
VSFYKEEKMEELIKTIGRSAKLRRLKKNISQEELAKLCGISIASITRFETGRGNISLQNLLAIFDELGMTEEFKLLFNMTDENLLKKSNDRVKWSQRNKSNTHLKSEANLEEVL